MRTSILRGVCLTIFALGTSLCVAQKAGSSSTRLRQEFPISLQTKVVAGQSGVGTKVEGKLFIATLAKGVVIPAGAVFTGEVEESIAQSTDSPARLKVHLTEAHWEGHSIPVDLYATGFYYERVRSAFEDSEPMVPPLDPRVPADRQRAPTPPPKPRHPPRRLMKDVTQERGEGNEIVLTSDKQNIHLDRDTLYSFEGAANEKPSPSQGEKPQATERK